MFHSAKYTAGYCALPNIKHLATRPLVNSYKMSRYLFIIILGPYALLNFNFLITE